MSLTLPSSFYQAAVAMLKAMHVAPTVVNVNLLAAWSFCEKPHTGAAAWQWNNPWNTTRKGFGETGTANSVGVGIYPTEADVIAANYAALTNGLYPHLIQALQTSNASLFFQNTPEIRTWGTDPACIQSIYSSLGSPPGNTLTTATAPGPSATQVAASTGIIPAVTGNSNIVLGAVIFIGGLTIASYEATEWTKLREWVGRKWHRGTISVKGD